MLMAVAQRRAAIYRDWLSPPGPPWRVRETGCLLCVSVCAWGPGSTVVRNETSREEQAMKQSAVCSTANRDRCYLNVCRKGLHETGAEDIVAEAKEWRQQQSR